MPVLALLAGCVTSAPQFQDSASALAQGRILDDAPFTLHRREGAPVAGEGLVQLPGGETRTITTRRIPVEVTALATGPVSEAEIAALRASVAGCARGVVTELTGQRQGAAWLFRFTCLETL